MIPIAEAFQPLTSVTLNKRMYSPVMRLDEYSPPIPNDSVYCPFPNWNNQQCAPVSHQPAGSQVSYSCPPNPCGPPHLYYNQQQQYQYPTTSYSSMSYQMYPNFGMASTVQSWILMLLFGLFALLALVIIIKKFGKIVSFE